MLRFRWSRIRRRCRDGATAIDEAVVGSAPRRWRTGRLNPQEDEIDDGSSSGEVDEGRRAIVWTTSSGKRLQLGSGEVADTGGWGFTARAERLWRPGISNGEKEAMGGGNHDLGTCSSKM